MSLPQLRPSDTGQVVSAVAQAVAAGQPLALVGAGSCRAWGRPVTAEAQLDLSGLTGVVDYAPRELVLTLRPGTPLAEISALLAGERQQLAFEPPDLAPLWGQPAGLTTLGGIIGTNRAGPRRFKAGAVRDHLLGAEAVSGWGQSFRCGGRVVKNVTGYDLPKLLAGSFGTLAALTEVTLRTVPQPERTVTVMIAGLGDGAAVAALGAALSGPHEVSGAAHLPAAVAARSAVAAVAAAGTAVTLLRLEGFGSSVVARSEGLRQALAGAGAGSGRGAEVVELTDEPSGALWAEIGAVRLFAGTPERLLWRLVVPPAEGAAVVARIAHELPLVAFYDWGGSLIWLELAAATPEAGAPVIRAAIGEGRGRADLLRAPEALRATVPVFQPEPPALAALVARVRQAFDPHGIFNRGRLAAEA